MSGLNVWLKDTLSIQQSQTQMSSGLNLNLNYSNSITLCSGGLFLDNTIPSSISVSKILDCSRCRRRPVVFGRFRWKIRGSEPRGVGFLSVSLSVKGNDAVSSNSNEYLIENGSKGCEELLLKPEIVAGGGPVTVGGKQNVSVQGRGAMNTTKHLWAGAVAAMVSRTVLAPLERLKLEYIIRGEQKNIVELVKTIAETQGLRGFWKGNLVNILRSAPFKSINFCVYDTYRKQLLRISGNKEITNVERFFAGAAAGITATALCLPLDTVRTKLVAHGGESLGGVIGAFRHIITTEGFFSLYKGLLPSIISIAPSSAVFYGVYDMLKAAYLHSPDGKARIEHMKQEELELNVFEKLELGPFRTLLHGAIAGACAEVATYPFEVVRRQLQLQARADKLSTLGTFLKIVENGGVPALYAGLLPSLLQVLPSASISYFVYEFMKIFLKVM